MLTTTQKSIALIVMLSLSVFSGCETTTNEMPYQTMDLAQPVDILHKVVGGHPTLNKPDLKLITSQTQLDALGVADLIGRDVNFNNESVVLASLGEMPTNGYWINITTIYQEGDTLQIYGSANRPSPDAMAGQVLTYPYCVVVIPSTSAKLLGDQIDSVQDQDPPM
jgi:protease stability complex PrcB-like protein